MDVWVEGELDGCDFPDQRLKDRLGTLLSDLGRRIGGTIPAACQDWAATKAAYRFLSNPRVDEAVTGRRLSGIAWNVSAVVPRPCIPYYR